MYMYNKRLSYDACTCITKGYLMMHVHVIFCRKKVYNYDMHSMQKPSIQDVSLFSVKETCCLIPVSPDDLSNPSYSYFRDNYY